MKRLPYILSCLLCAGLLAAEIRIATDPVSVTVDGQRWAPATLPTTVATTVPASNPTTIPATIPATLPTERRVVDFGGKPGFAFGAGNVLLSNVEIRNSYLPVSASAATDSLTVRDVTCIGAPDPGAKQSCFSYTSQAKAVTFERVRFVAPGGGWAIRSYSPKTIIRDCTFVSLPPANNCLIRLHAPADGSDLDLTIENNRVVCVPLGYPQRNAGESIDAWIDRLIAYTRAHPDAGKALDVLTLSNGDGSGHAPGAGKFRGVIRNNTFIGGVKFSGGVDKVLFNGNLAIRRNDPIVSITDPCPELEIDTNLLVDPGNAQWGGVAHGIKGYAPGRSANNWYTNPQGKQANAGPGVTLVQQAPAGQWGAR